MHPLDVFAASYCTLLVLLLFRFALRRWRSPSIALLPGPTSNSWLVGNLPGILRPDTAAEVEFSWFKEHGTALRIKGAFGQNILFVADPKAIQYILNTGGYDFPKPQMNMALSRLISGEGLTYAQGARHARHRKIMNPAFSNGTLREFLPIFRHTAQRMTSFWRDVMAQNGSTSVVLNVHEWLSRTTLDAIGAAGFGYRFGALDQEENELTKQYSNLFADSFFQRSDFTIAFQALWGHLPMRIVKLIQKLPTRQLKRTRTYMSTARRVAKTMVDTQTQSYLAGNKGGKDIMSLLIRANLAEDEKSKLGDGEMMAQLTTLMLAGHETSATTTSWALYELSKCRQLQSELRKEIKETRARSVQRGKKGELSMADLNSMKYLLAVVKETLRCHPIVNPVNREAARDDVIPLSIPVRTKSGDVMTSIPVAKGQQLVISVAMYNRLESVWGEDANEWKPERFLEEKAEDDEKTRLGMIGNVGTFSSGVRGCIGWRFAVIEMQEILIELLENFEFSPAPGNPEIIRMASGLVHPMVKGIPGRTQLPLAVTLVVE